MEQDRQLISELISSLKQQRDELKVQMQLAQNEMRDEYNRLSSRIEELSRQYEPVRKEVGQTATNVFAALKLAGEEMLAGFDRIRKSMKK